ncbi:Uncharacterized protein HZ326_28642 [Fusarium oxysporum f. sp. albedinis]|nr:Uncharacterized protein HZ326_28642 [Fusarium oxysporum f. sp. albedinis]
MVMVDLTARLATGASSALHALELNCTSPYFTWSWGTWIPVGTNRNPVSNDTMPRPPQYTRYVCRVERFRHFVTHLMSNAHPWSPSLSLTERKEERTDARLAGLQGLSHDPSLEPAPGPAGTKLREQKVT